MKAQIIFLATCLCLFILEVKTISYVDSDPKTNIQNLAETVCKTNRGTKNLIGRTSTINKLVDFFTEVESDHKLFDCRKRYMSPLAQLAHVIESFSNDVCGQNKLDLIENYHRKYISRARKHLKEQRRGNQAPEMAKLFFMQYVTKISSFCEQSALDTISKSKQTFSLKDLSKVESLRKFTDSLGMTDLSNGYNGIYLFWNMVDALDLDRTEKYSSYLVENAIVRINVQMKKARPIKAVQALCRYQLKPIYLKSLLPVLRLIDMGYYPEGDKLAKKFESDPTTRSLFFATQICETLLPIELFLADDLSQEQLVVLTKDEASKLEPVKLEESMLKIAFKTPVEEVVVPRSLSSLDELIFKPISASMLNTIKSNVDSRGKIINRMLKHLYSLLKSKLLSVFDGFKLFHRGHNKELEPISEELIKEMGPLQISEMEEGQEVKELTRTKRAGLIGELGYITYLLVFFLFYVLRISFMIIPTLFVIPLILCGKENTAIMIFNFWLMGDPLDV